MSLKTNQQLITLILLAAMSIIASILSIVIATSIALTISGNSDFGKLSYLILLLHVRWFVAILLGGVLLSVLFYFFGGQGKGGLRLFILAIVNALVMVAFRESETAFRRGVFSADYLEDILRNSTLFIPYVLLLPLLFIALIKIRSRKPRIINMDVSDTLDL